MLNVKLVVHHVTSRLKKDKVNKHFSSLAAVKYSVSSTQQREKSCNLFGVSEYKFAIFFPIQFHGVDRKFRTAGLGDIFEHFKDLSSFNLYHKSVFLFI